MYPGRKLQSICVLFVVGQILASVFCLRDPEELYGIFNLLELESNRYELDITNVPVTSSILRDADQPSIVVRTIKGQAYSCSLPNREDEANSEADINANIDTNITSYITYLQNKCLVKNKGWWTYQYCHYNNISQFHLEGGNTGNVISLGEFHDEEVWDHDKISRTMSKRKTGGVNDKALLKLPSHYFSYHNGTLCDINGKKREAHVQVVCSPFHYTDKIIEIVEHETCNYTLVIHCNKLCKHPLFATESRMMTNVITCSPLLTEKQYQKYMNKKIKRLQKEVMSKEEENLKQAQVESLAAAVVALYDALSDAGLEVSGDLAQIDDDQPVGDGEEDETAGGEDAMGAGDDENSYDDDGSDDDDKEEEDLDKLIDDIVERTLKRIFQSVLDASTDDDVDENPAAKDDSSSDTDTITDTDDTSDTTDIEYITDTDSEMKACQSDASECDKDNSIILDEEIEEVSSEEGLNEEEENQLRALFEGKSLTSSDDDEPKDTDSDSDEEPLVAKPPKNPPHVSVASVDFKGKEVPVKLMSIEYEEEDEATSQVMEMLSSLLVGAGQGSDAKKQKKMEAHYNTDWTSDDEAESKINH